MVRKSDHNNTDASLPPFASEELLFEAAADVSGNTLLCTSPGLAQFGGGVAEQLPAAVVHQGQRTLSGLSGKYFGQEVIVPAGHFHFAFDTLSSGMAFEQADGEAS